MKKFIPIVILLMISALPLSQANAAWRELSLPGTNCKYYGTQGDDNHISPLGLGANGLKNTSPYTQHVICPLTFPRSRRAMNWAMVTVKAQVTCRLYIRDRYGSSFSVYHPTYTNRHPNNVSQPTFSVPGKYYAYKIGDSGALFCSMTPNSEIISYDYQIR